MNPRSPSQLRVGVVGLGVLGRIMAGHLATAFGEVHVHDAIDPSAVPDGWRWCPTPREVALACDVVVLSLPSPDAVESVVVGAEGLLSSGRSSIVVVDTSTVDPQTNRAIWAQCATQGVGYLDAPLSGGEPFGTGEDGARRAEVTFMIGGTAQDVAHVEPVLRVLGKHWFHLGSSGTGTIVKLASNLASGLHALVAAEALALTTAHGIEPGVVREVFEHTDGKSYFFTDYVWPRFERSQFEPGFAVRHQLKDHRLAGTLAADAGVRLPLNAEAIRWWTALADGGDAAADVTVAVARSVSSGGAPA